MNIEHFANACMQIGFAIGSLGAGIAVGILIPVILAVLIYKVAIEFK